MGQQSRLAYLLIIGLAAAVWMPSGTAEVSDADVEQKIMELKASIIRAQQPDGAWGYSSYPVGITALCLHALLQADVPKDDPVVTRAARYLVKNSDKKVYSESLVAVALEQLDAKIYGTRIRKASNYLEATQLKGGSWSYALKSSGGGDNSNTQFAALGLGAAIRAGVPVDKNVIKQALNHWLNTQAGSGSWGYSRSGGTFPMTCAGLASLKVLGLTYARRDKSCAPYEYQANMHKAAQWVTAKLKSGRGLPGSNQLYALYALERVALHLQVKTFDGFDWYRWGATYISNLPVERKQIHDQAFALLFLAKGSAPIAIAKCEWGGDWNNQRHDVSNWCTLAGDALERKFDWLSSPIDSLDAPAAKASMVFITGTQQISLNDGQVDFLKAFLDQGGTVVAEKSCDSMDFIRSFKKEVEDNVYKSPGARWERLSSSHPVCSIKYPISLDEIDGYSFRVGCKRVNLLLLERNISCALNGDPDKAADLDRARKLATNILVWSLKQKAAEKKLDTAKLTPSDDSDALTIDQIMRKKAEKSLAFNQPFARLKHRGIWYAAPRYFDTLNKLLKMREQFPKFDAEVYIDATSEDLYNSAMVMVTGYENPMFSQEEALSMRSYIHNGGVFFASNACSSVEFDKGFRLMMKRIFPNDDLQVIPADDKVYKTPFDLTQKPAEGTAAYTKKYKQTWAPLEGIRRDGRWVVIYSPIDLTSDISDGLHESVEGYKKESAATLSINIFSTLLAP